VRLGRVAREGLDGVEARLVAVHPERGLAIDLRAAERLRRERRGATPAAGDDAWLPLDGLSWLPAVDPPVMRDCLAFKEHLVNASARAGALMNPAHYERPGYYKGTVSGLITKMEPNRIVNEAPVVAVCTVPR